LQVVTPVAPLSQQVLDFYFVFVYFEIGEDDSLVFSHLDMFLNFSLFTLLIAFISFVGEVLGLMGD
jgi:hypothetical protein